MALIQGTGSMIPECLKVLLFLCSFSTVSAFSRGVAMKIVTAVAFDGANLALPAGNPTCSNASLQHHAVFPGRGASLSYGLWAGWPLCGHRNHSSRQSCSVSLFRAVIPAHRWGCSHAVPVPGVAVCSWMLWQARRIPGAARHHQLITLSCAHQIQSIFRERGFFCLTGVNFLRSVCGFQPHGSY